MVAVSPEAARDFAAGDAAVGILLVEQAENLRLGHPSLAVAVTVTATATALAPHAEHTLSH